LYPFDPIPLLVAVLIIAGTGQTILFYTYAPVNSGYSYSRFIEDRKGLCPLHSARIKDYLMTFEKERACPCGWHE
jgi:hypothetical protein